MMIEGSQVQKLLNKSYQTQKINVWVPQNL